jgi:hypothetical protein
MIKIQQRNLRRNNQCTGTKTGRKWFVGSQFISAESTGDHRGNRL